MKLSDASKKIIRDALIKALAHYKGESDMETVTDIHLQPNQVEASLVIYDDDDRELAHTKINEWVSYESDDFDEEVQQIFTSTLSELKAQGALDDLHILKPFSFVQVDEHKETVAELLLIDDDTLLVNNELLKGLDDELNAFLKDLLEL